MSRSEGIKVWIVRARGLRTADIGVGKSSDPYVQVAVF